ncbi:glycoside hydrolase family 19 protein [Paraburkholderia sp. BR14374]|uniref:glycoside hydrolase family 19 protein n=1 Tax=Paraburkholderia sp. BR14374 TaxID=3237007 RepID=UPI0034CE8FE1
MTSKPAHHRPQTPQPPGLRQLAFAFPFLRKAQGNAAASAQFTDEHDIYRLLATNESSGSYLVSRKGMWHGGIHITEAGAGQALDLDAGLRCIADGVLIAYRANQDYPVSEASVDGSNVPLQAPYSTGFALVRHEMEFPRGTKLTFYSLYMHLMSNADYDNFPKRQKPAYWSRQWQVTQFAQDRPRPGRSGQIADPSQVGLPVRRTPNGSIVGILPQGAGVSIGKTEMVHGATWGQLTDLNGATLYAPEAGGYVATSAAVGGWICLGAQNGGPVVNERIPDSMFDRVIVTTNRTCSAGDPQGTAGGFPVKAGDLIGHPGRYDPLNACTSGTRMAHIEVFCGEGIRQFIKSGRDWVRANCAHEDRWSGLGLSPEPPILRVERGTTLYHDHANGQSGKDPKQTDVVQAYRFAALPQDDGHRFMEKDPGSDGTKRRWWKVDSADMRGNPIRGWVREQSFEGGRVTREFSQSWIDFECHDEDHDPTHTIFATTGDYVDYALGTETSGAGSLGKLSPLMAAIYRALYPGADGLYAADELCSVGQSPQHSGFPWAAFRASRLIAKHESEWANPAKWQALVSAIEERTGLRPEHEEEKKRIAKLVWWDEVAAGVPGFPGSDVYHINPIGLVGNFLRSERSLAELIRKIGDIISGGEGGYESYNTGTNGAHGAVGHSYMTKPKGTVTGKTINEILATEHFSYMNPARFYTTGKYQTIIPTLREGKARLRLTGDEKYDEDVQERMFGEFLIFHAGGGVLAKFIKQGVGTVDDAQYAASKEWASIAAPAGCRIKDGRISDGSLSYYEGANNHAYMPSTNRLRSTLAEISQSR